MNTPYILYKEFSINNRIYNITPIADMIYGDITSGEKDIHTVSINHEIINKDYKLESQLSNSVSVKLEPVDTFMRSLGLNEWYTNYNFDIDSVNLPPFRESVLSIMKASLIDKDNTIKSMINENKSLSELIMDLKIKYPNELNIEISLNRDTYSNTDKIATVGLFVYDNPTAAVLPLFIYPK